MHTTKTSKALQIISAFLLTSAVWVIGIPVSGYFVNADVSRFSSGVPILNILYPLIIALYAAFCGKLCKKKGKKAFFITAMVFLLLPHLSYPMIQLTINTVLVVPFMVMITCPASIAMGASEAIADWLQIPSYPISEAVWIITMLLPLAGIIAGIIIYRKSKFFIS